MSGGKYRMNRMKKIEVGDIITIAVIIFAVSVFVYVVGSFVVQVYALPENTTDCNWGEVQEFIDDDKEEEEEEIEDEQEHLEESEAWIEERER